MPIHHICGLTEAKIERLWPQKHMWNGFHYGLVSATFFKGDDVRVYNRVAPEIQTYGQVDLPDCLGMIDLTRHAVTCF